MRDKIYYTPNQITNNLFTAGGEYQLSDGTEYKGSYHTYTSGEVYTLSEYGIGSVKLFPYINTNQLKYSSIRSDIKTKFIAPTPGTPNIVPNGRFNRYFISRRNDYMPEDSFEIDSDMYDKYTSGKIDQTLYIAKPISWSTTTDEERLPVIRMNNAIAKKSIAVYIPLIFNILPDNQQYSMLPM